ncbi:MAG: hypothetical protein HY327_02750 [Chloroflexi bacterium]|nr:hypothetical protein [Chloroflexota bacterium]
MVVEHALYAIVIGGCALGAGLLVNLVISQSVTFLERAWRRGLGRVLRQTVSGSASGSTIRVPWSLAQLLAVAAASVLAIKSAMTGGVIIAIYLALVGIFLGWFFGKREGASTRERTTGDIVQLVVEFQSVYRVTRTVFGAFTETVDGIVNPILKIAVQRAIDAFNTGKRMEDALNQVASDVPNPYLAQLVFILTRAPQSSEEVVQNALKDLSERLRQHQRLSDRSRVSLALVSGTVRFLQAANGAVLLVCVLAPLWWDYYRTHPAVLIVGATLALFGSWYFENQLRLLHERVV